MFLAFCGRTEPPAPTAGRRGRRPLQAVIGGACGGTMQISPHGKHILQKSTPAAIGCGGASVSINPHPCHSEPVTDVTGVGIRNLLAGNLRKSAGIMRFGNGLPRQCEHWLAMTDFFDSLERRAHSARRFCALVCKNNFHKVVYFRRLKCYTAISTRKGRKKEKPSWYERRNPR